MKKLNWIIVLIVCALITACGSNSTNKSESINTAEDKKDVEKTETENEDSDTKDFNVEKHKEKVEPKYQVSDTWSVKPINDSTEEKVVLLTIDDAPDQYALEMAKTLKKLDANAIFFVNGHLIQSLDKQEQLKQIHDMGFVIGNHTYSHAFLPDLSEEEQKEEIIRVNDRVEEIVGERPQFFRAPNGANTDYTKQIAKEESMILMNWSYGYDWNKEYMSKDALTEIMLHTELLGNGSNILMHDREWTAAALHEIVTGLRDQGYEIVDPKLIKTIE